MKPQFKKREIKQELKRRKAYDSYLRDYDREIGFANACGATPTPPPLPEPLVIGNVKTKKLEKMLLAA